jgi:dihydroflavonol-4-reductase
MLKEQNRKVLGVDLHEGPFTNLMGSVADPLLWQNIPEIGGVIHGAALTDLWRRDPSDFERINAEGARLAGLFAAERGVPLVYVSSYTALIDASVRKERVLTGEEEIPPGRLIGAYAVSKRRGELLVKENAPHAAVVLPTAPLGPGDHLLTPPMRLVRDVASGKLPGVMRGRINIVDVRDVARGTLAALDRGAGGRFLLSGEDFSLRELADLTADGAGVKPPRLTVPKEVAGLAALVSQAVAALGGPPPQAPRAGVQLASQRVRFDGSRSRRALGLAQPDSERTIRDAVSFLRHEGLLAG